MAPIVKVVTRLGGGRDFYVESCLQNYEIDSGRRDNSSQEIVSVMYTSLKDAWTLASDADYPSILGVFEDILDRIDDDV